MQAANTTTVAQKNYPSLVDRIISTFIDSLFVLGLMIASASILDKYENPPDWIRIVLFFGLFAIYEPICTAYACTLGNYIKGIRVRRVSNSEKRINILLAFIRYVFKASLGWVSFLTMHTNPERRTIHDFVSGSIMIKV